MHPVYDWFVLDAKLRQCFMELHELWSWILLYRCGHHMLKLLCGAILRKQRCRGMHLVQRGAVLGRNWRKRVHRVCFRHVPKRDGIDDVH